MYIALSYIPSISYRSLTVNDPLFDGASVLNLRETNETGTSKFSFYKNFSVKAGYNYRKSHLFYFEFTKLQLGFSAMNHAVDWSSGLVNSTPGGSVKNYCFNSLLLGVGYCYQRYNIYRKLNVALDMGVYYAGKTNGIENKVYMKNNRIGVKAGLGVVYNLNYRFDIKCMPTLYYDLTALAKEKIKTNLYNIGLSIGIGVKLIKVDKFPL